MENNKLNWCFKLKDGLRIIDPNQRLSKSYLEMAKLSMLGAEKDLKDNDLLWATVKAYYAEYYALYSFLQRIGIKCENHACSILAATMLLGNDKTDTIARHKDKRIDAQYYMKTDQEAKIKIMHLDAKAFIAEFDELISELSEKDIMDYRKLLSAK